MVMKQQLGDKVASWDFVQILESYFNCQLPLICQEIDGKIQNFFFY